MNAERLKVETIVALVASILLVGAGYLWGDSAATNACNAAKVTPLEAAIERHNDQVEVAKVVETKSVTRAARTEAVFTGIQQGVVTYAQAHHAVPGDCRLDADGLRLWTAANANAAPDPATGGQGAMPAAAAAGEPANDGSAGQPHRGGEGVSPVPGQAPGADGLAGES